MFQCQECKRTFRTVQAAQHAASVGCPKCGGVDIDLAEPKQRQPRPKPARSIRMIEAPAANDPAGYFAVEIAIGKQADSYLCHPIPAGYEVEKLDDQLAPVESYLATLDADAASCTCKGHERHRHCKHVDGLEALRRAGKLAPIAVAGAA